MAEPRSPSSWNPDLFRPQDWRSPADYRRRQMLIVLASAAGALALLAIASAMLARRAARETEGSLLRSAPHTPRAATKRERAMGAPGKRGAKVSRRERRDQGQEDLP